MLSMNRSCGDCFQYWSCVGVRNLLVPHNFLASLLHRDAHSKAFKCTVIKITVQELEEIIDSMIAVTFYQTSMSLESELCIS